MWWKPQILLCSRENSRLLRLQRQNQNEDIDKSQGISTFKIQSAKIKVSLRNKRSMKPHSLIQLQNIFGECGKVHMNVKIQFLRHNKNVSPKRIRSCKRMGVIFSDALQLTWIEDVCDFVVTTIYYSHIPKMPQ